MINLGLSNAADVQIQRYMCSIQSTSVSQTDVVSTMLLLCDKVLLFDHVNMVTRENVLSAAVIHIPVTKVV